MDPDRPHFIVFMTDQQRADLLGCAGHPVLKTPHIDAVAARGVRFERFYVANPVCMPNRASLMTGRASSVHGVRCNGMPLPLEQVTFVELLAAAGYATTLVGKAHLQNMTGSPPILQRPAPNASMQRLDGLDQAVRTRHADARYQQEADARDWADPATRVQTPYYGFQHVDLCTGHGDLVRGNYVAWAQARGLDLDRTAGAANALPHDMRCPQAWRTAVPEELYPSRYIAEQACAALDRHAGDERPFFLLVSFPDPHHPFTPPGRYWDMYDPASMPPEAAYARSDWQPPPHVQAVFDQRNAGRANLNGHAAFAVDAEEARQAHALSCAMVSMIDDAVGQVLARLQHHGLTQRTVVAFTSDHGDFLGDHRLLLKGPAHYQSLIRVPMVWADPAEPEVAGSTRQALASSIDLPATVLARAGIERPWGMQGLSLLETVASGRPVRASVLVEEEQQRHCFGFAEPPRVHTLVTERWRLSLFRGVAWGELYDLQQDPGEFVNLWGDAAHLVVKADLLAEFARTQITMQDDCPFPTGQA
ncbi:MAG: sulfatase-like hydrolase/transferase [Burkholderiaceae bacterium]